MTELLWAEPTYMHHNRDPAKPATKPPARPTHFRVPVERPDAPIDTNPPPRDNPAMNQDAAPKPTFSLRAPADPAAIALGCMNFGKRTPLPEAARIVERALDHGVALLDTANAYGDGESERLLGQILKALPPSARAKAKIATKVGFWRREGLAPARVIASLDESLGRLGVEQVELFYLHVPDHQTPIASTLEGIATIVASGKARAFGVSNYASWQILEIITLCDQLGIPRPAVSQQVYNLLIRQLDIEYLRFAKQYELHTTVYNPLAGGLLAGRPTTADTQPGTRFHKNGLYQRRYLSDVFFDATNAFTDLAREHNLSILTLAYAWLARRPGVDSILVGPGSTAHLNDALAALEVTLTPETLTRVDQIHRALVGTDTTYAR